MSNRDIVPKHVKPLKQTRRGRVYACQHCDHTFHAEHGTELRELFWNHLYEQHRVVLKFMFMFKMQPDVEPRKWAKFARKAGAKKVDV